MFVAVTLLSVTWSPANRIPPALFAQTTYSYETWAVCEYNF